jgi:hypothetical protein
MADTVKKEIQAFIQEPVKLTLANGKTLEIKPLSWKKELQLIKLFGKLFEEGFSPDYITYFDKENVFSGSKFISILLQTAPDILTEMVQVITDLDKETIENDLVFEDIIEITFPFLGNIVVKLKKTIQTKINPLLTQITA